MYSKDQIIGQTTNAGTGYQIRFTVHYGAGADIGENVYLNSNSRTDFGDVRFFEGATELDYWMEFMTASTVAIFWVKLNTDLNSGAGTVTLKYGNATATTTSSGPNTFEFFDDFSATLSQWTTHKQLGSASITIPTGQSYVRFAGGTALGPFGHAVLGSSPGYTAFNNNAVEYRYRLGTDAISEVGIRGNFVTGGGTGFKVRSDQRAANPGQGILSPAYYMWNFVVPGGGYAGTRPTVDTWYRGTATVYGTGSNNMRFYRDGALMNTVSCALSAGEISLQNHFGVTDYDWVLVRKFAGAEPTRGDWGTEITLPVELSSFTAIPTAEYFVRLNWVTQSETGVSGFKIFRGRNNELAEATDMNVFIEAINTASTQAYSYVDNALDGNGSYYYWLQNIDLDGGSRYYGPVTATVNQTGGGETPPIELRTGIEKIYPNPFNPQTNIRFSLVQEAPVEVVIFNLRGQKVRNLLSAQKAAGFHNLEWNGLDNSGMPCSSGVYTVQVRIGTEVYSKQMVMSK